MLFSLVGWNPEEGRERLSRASPFTSRSNDAHSRTQKGEVGQSQEVTLIELSHLEGNTCSGKGSPAPPPILIHLKWEKSNDSHGGASGTQHHSHGFLPPHLPLLRLLHCIPILDLAFKCPAQGLLLGPLWSHPVSQLSPFRTLNTRVR